MSGPTVNPRRFQPPLPDRFKGAWWANPDLLAQYGGFTGALREREKYPWHADQTNYRPLGWDTRKASE